MRILLVVAPFSLIERHGRVAPAASNYHSLGIASIAAVLRDKGHAVSLLECEALGLGLDDVGRAVREQQPELVGMQQLYHTAAVVEQVARRVKQEQPQVRVVVGGLHPTMYPEQALDCPAIDLAVLGEGERTIGELVGALEWGAPLESVRGIAWRKDGRVVTNPPQPLIEDLDAEVPPPALDLFPMERYHSAAQLRGKRTLHLVTSRGCPYGCGFCLSNRAFGRTWRAFGPQRVLAELETLTGSYQADAIQFFDDVFTLDRERTLEICTLLQHRAPRIPWSCFTRVDLVDPELLAQMAAAGCYQIFYGVETAVPRLIELLGKGIAPEQVRSAFAATRACGIEVFASVVLGLPTETPEEAETTFRFVLEVDPDYAYWFPYTPWPGTPLHATARESGTFLTEEASRYTIHHAEPVYLARGWTADALAQAEQSMMRRFYLRPRKLARLARSMRRLPAGKLLALIRSGTAVLAGPRSVS